MAISLKGLKKKADTLLSKYIRLRDCPCECPTCGTWIDYDNSDAGHFISRNHQSTRYDLRNVHAQCRKCNRFNSGKQWEFGCYIGEVWGKLEPDRILIKSKQLCKRNRYDYEVLIKDLQHKISLLQKD